MITPKVSCLISTYAGDDAELLGTVLENIAAQTYDRKEIILVVDGPVPDVLEQIITQASAAHKDLFKLVRLDVNVGLAAALNAGLAACKGQYVARFDADDISDLVRLEKQVAFLDDYADFTVVGSNIKMVDVKTKAVSTKTFPAVIDCSYLWYWYRCPVAHPTVMFRKIPVVDLGGYPNFRRAQDYALWGVLLRNGHKIKVLQENLVSMGIASGLYKRRGYAHFKHEMKVIRFLHKIGMLNIFGRTAATAGRFARSILNDLFRLYSESRGRQN